MSEMNDVLETNKVKTKLPTAAALCAAYVLFVALRLVGVYNTGYPHPTVMMDEAIYINLARSLWTNHAALFFGQPIPYNYLLYPLTLAPLYALPESISIMAALRTVNVLLINLTLFPAFFLALRVTGERRVAWFTALFAVLVPEMNMAHLIMSENLAYPLMMLGLLSIVNACEPERGALGWTALSALCAVLLYETKPGFAALGGMMLLYLIWRAVRQHARVDIVRLGVFLVVAAPVFLALRGWFSMLQPLAAGGEVGLYSSQLRTLSLYSLKTIGIGVAVHAFFFVCAYGFLPVLIPAAHRAPFTPPQRALRAVTLGALLLMIVGTSYSVYMPEASPVVLQSRFHLRYLFYFIPALVALTLAPQLRNQKGNITFYALGALVLAGIVWIFLPALSRGLNIATLTLRVPALLLAFGAPGWTVQLGAALLLVCGIAWAAWRGVTRGLAATLSAVLIALMLFDTGFYYYGVLRDTRMEPADDAQQLYAWTQEKPTVLVQSEVNSILFIERGCEFYTSVPVSSLTNLPTVLADEEGPIPFLPTRLWMEQPAYEITAQRLIFYETALPVLQFQPDTSLIFSDTNIYFYLDVPTNRSFAAAMLCNTLIGGQCIVGTLIKILDPDLYRQAKIRLELTVETPVDSEVNLALGQQSLAIPLVEGVQTIEAVFEGDPEATEPAQIFISMMGAIEAWHVEGIE